MDCWSKSEFVDILRDEVIIFFSAGFLGWVGERGGGKSGSQPYRDRETTQSTKPAERGKKNRAGTMSLRMMEVLFCRAEWFGRFCGLSGFIRLAGVFAPSSLVGKIKKSACCGVCGTHVSILSSDLFLSIRFHVEHLRLFYFVSRVTFFY